MILCGMMVCGINCGIWVYESSKSAVLLEGEKSDTFTIEQGVAQGCSLSPYYFQYSLMICGV